MPAFPRFTSKTLLSSLAIALVLAAPQVFAKKDLFANDPGSTHSPHAEQLAPSASSSSVTPPESATLDSEALDSKSHSKSHNNEKEITEKKEGDIAGDAPPSYLEKQFARFKSNLTEAKEDLFGSKKSAKKNAPSVPDQTETTTNDTANSSEESPTPTISAAEAAQRAQAVAEGQVINVRKYQEDDKPRYAVKLLQKNGRMKTIHLDAVSGALIEDVSQ